MEFASSFFSFESLLWLDLQTMNTGVALKKVFEFISILKDGNILCLNFVMIDISHLLGIK